MESDGPIIVSGYSNPDAPYCHRLLSYCVTVKTLDCVVKNMLLQAFLKPSVLKTILEDFPPPKSYSQTLRVSQGAMAILDEALPLDILLEILGFIPPRMIIQKVRVLNKAMKSISELVILWTTLLHRVCREDCIFAPTFPFHQMTVKDLEHAVTRPNAFLSRILASRLNPGQSLQGYEEQYLDFFGMPPGYGVEHQLRCLYVVPGGRFLVTSHLERPLNLRSLDWVSYLNIWDAGWLQTPEPPESMRCQPPIASFRNRAVGNMTPVHPTRDGEGLLLFARKDEDHYATFSQGDRLQHFYIYEIYPTKLIPPREVGKLSLDVVGEEKCCLSFERLAMIFSRTMIIIWDFTNNTLASWESPVLQGQNVQTIILKGNHILLVLDDDFLIWDIPELYPAGDDRTNPQSIDPIWSCPMDRLQIPSSEQLCRFSIEKLDDWYTDSRHPIYLDAVIQSGHTYTDFPHPSLPSIVRYRVTIPNSLVDKYGFPVAKTAVVTQFAKFYDILEPTYHEDSPKYYRISRGNIVVNRIRRESDLYIYSHDIVRGPSFACNTSFLQLPQVEKKLADLMYLNHVAVCPTSGRIFTYLPRNPEEIMIAETTRHPDWRGGLRDLTLRIYDPDTDPTRH